jgi:hypothetical protein
LRKFYLFKFSFRSFLLKHRLKEHLINRFIGFCKYILLALKSGGLADDAISGSLAANDTSAAALGTWGPGYLAGMDRMRKLVCAFYDGLNFGRIVRRHGDAKALLTDILIGDFFKNDIDILWPLLDQEPGADCQGEVAVAVPADRAGCDG